MLLNILQRTGQLLPTEHYPAQNAVQLNLSFLKAGIKVNANKLQCTLSKHNIQEERAFLSNRKRSGLLHKFTVAGYY